MTDFEIDEVARMGYQYAKNSCKGIPSLNYSDDMELMAFNAGIMNFNTRNGTVHPKYKPLTASFTKGELSKNRFPA